MPVVEQRVGAFPIGGGRGLCQCVALFFDNHKLTVYLSGVQANSALQGGLLETEPPPKHTQSLDDPHITVLAPLHM